MLTFSDLEIGESFKIFCETVSLHANKYVKTSDSLCECQGEELVIDKDCSVSRMKVIKPSLPTAHVTPLVRKVVTSRAESKIESDSPDLSLRRFHQLTQGECFKFPSGERIYVKRGPDAYRIKGSTDNSFYEARAWTPVVTEGVNQDHYASDGKRIGKRSNPRKSAAKKPVKKTFAPGYNTNAEQ
jgi:hypothetical protein